MASFQEFDPDFSRRRFLRNLGVAPVLLRSAPLHGLWPAGPVEPAASSAEAQSPEDVYYKPSYPARSPIEGLLRLVPPGTDEYTEEQYAAELTALLTRWGGSLEARRYDAILESLNQPLMAGSLIPSKIVRLRPDDPIESTRREHAERLSPIEPESFLTALKEWVGPQTSIERSHFEITSLTLLTQTPLAVASVIRYDILVNTQEGRREQRIGTWSTEWLRDQAQSTTGVWKLRQLQPHQEVRTSANGPVFVDVTGRAFGHIPSYQDQMRHGADYWRTALEGACGIDVYGNNGIAAGDFNKDGLDDLYVSQPAGLPNRLYRNRGDGTFEDVTEAAGVGVLDNTSCALFADLRNTGLQDLVVVCGGGPLLFLNQGNGTFQLKPDAFQFAHPPQGTFTHAALSDYDRDGRLDLYFCVYSYYLGLDQYHYPVPYFDARNGPPNFLMHNQGDGTFVDRTEASGLQVENDRYSFACAWNESSTTHMPDLYVVNDFGRNNLYRNNGDGTFTAVSTRAHAEDVGAGMSACWMDFNNDGRNDLYVANMWSAAGLRVSQQPRFHREAPDNIRALYRQHAQGNALYQGDPDGEFRNVSRQAAADVGRWAWCSDSWDFDHDGFADLYVTNGYISAPRTRDDVEHATDLGSFFWRQLVAKSPNDSTPSLAYEHGWNAINELIRSDHSWNGSERNVLFANNRDGTFSEVSAVAGMDLIEDGRSFALADLDHDGRLEVIVKNRNGPQLRVLRNVMHQIGGSIAFRLEGIRSNRDAIGASLTLDAGDLHQTKTLQSGTGFLAQHTREVFFGLGKTSSTVNATVRWPSGLVQRFEALPRNHRIQLVEGNSTFAARPFAPLQVHTAEATAIPDPAVRAVPITIETWLIDPLKSPAFSLPNLSGATVQSQSFAGSVTLLIFWSSTSSASQGLLQAFHRQRVAVAAASLKVVAINLDPAGQSAAARHYLEQQRYSFSTLFATDDFAGIYNIIFRYLFDRRRDLPIPVAFLIDAGGMIVKVYQRAFDPASPIADARAIPATAAERMKKALPFPGKLYQGQFLRNDFTYGVAMFQHGYLDQAEESFRQVVASKPNDAEGFYNLGTLNLRKNNFAQARIDLEQTLKLRPNYPEAWNNLGMMAAQQGHPQEAIENFKQSLALRPGYTTALLNLGNVYRRQGAFPEAKDALTRALALQPDDPEANYSLGMFFAQQDQLKSAEEYLQKAADLRPGYAEALNNLGVIAVRQQDNTAAEERFKTCIRIVPSFDAAYLNLARLYLSEHQKLKARVTIEELLRLRPESPAGKQGLQMLQAEP